MPPKDYAVDWRRQAEEEKRQAIRKGLIVCALVLVGGFAFGYFVGML